MAQTKLTKLRNNASNNFARAYKYKFEIKPVVTGTSLPQLAGLPLLEDPKNLIETSCLNATVPSSGSQMIEVEVGRHTLREPGREDTPGTITPEFLLSGDYLIYKFFRRWKERSSPSYGGIQSAVTSDFHATITITGYDANNAEQIRHILHNCWCRNAPEIPHADESNDIIRWSPEIAYEFIELATAQTTNLESD
jgi:hypothetical protein